MKRARKKNGGKKNENQREKREYKYESDMTELGYDPDSFVEPEETPEEIPEDIDAENLPEEENFSETEPEEEPSDGEALENENPEDGISVQQPETSESHKPKKKSRKKLLIFTVSIITVMAVFFVALGFGGFFNPSTEIDEDYVMPVDKATGKINVLVLGVDKDGLRTDTIIVASYDLDDNTVKLLSIPRDTRMYIGNRYQKINAAHAISQSGKIKGPQGSIEAVSRLTGIPINYYVEFSFDAFKNTIDALGGVDFDVPQDMNYEDPVQDLYIHLKKGYQHLDGDKAEQFVRFRKYPMGDIARVEAQQAFIKALAEQKLNLSILENVPELFGVISNDINTNFTLIDVMKYVNNLKELSADNITMYPLPGNFGGGEYTTSYWIADMDAVKTLIETEFGYDASEITIHSEDGKSISRDGADRRATQKPKQTSGTGTSKPKASSATAKPSQTAATTHKPTESHKATREPTATSKATQKPAAETVSPTEKPTEKPVEKPTEKPQETVKPARPTPKADTAE